MRRPAACAHRNSTSCTNTPGAHPAHMGAGSNNHLKHKHRKGIYTPVRSVDNNVRQNTNPQHLFDVFTALSSLKNRSFNRAESERQRCLRTRFAAVKATDNNKRFTQSRNSKNLSSETQRQYLAVKE